MRTITYRFKRWQLSTILIAAPAALVAMTLLVFLLSPIARTDARWVDALLEDPASNLGSLFILMACAAILVFTLKPGGARRSFLRLDDEGLTYGNLFGTHRWPWIELSGFDLHRRTGVGARVTFTPPGTLGRSVNQLGDRALIEDIYDAPLEEIAATLNEYRDRALESGGSDAAGFSPVATTQP